MLSIFMMFSGFIKMVFIKIFRLILSKFKKAPIEPQLIENVPEPSPMVTAKTKKRASNRPLRKVRFEEPPAQELELQDFNAADEEEKKTPEVEQPADELEQTESPSPYKINFAKWGENDPLFDNIPSIKRVQE